MESIEYKLYQLSKSKFRSKFHLSDKDKEYIKEKGIDIIEKHTREFLNKNLKIKSVKDGKQTPYRGHPVFVAQHATATCCRKCMNKWYGISEDIELDDNQINYFIKIIITFIKNDI